MPYIDLDGHLVWRSVVYNVFTYCTCQVFNTRYPEMHKVQRAKCAISKLMYGVSVCTDDNRSLKLVAHRLVHTDEPYINLTLVEISIYAVQLRTKHNI